MRRSTLALAAVTTITVASAVTVRIRSDRPSAAPAAIAPTQAEEAATGNTVTTPDDATAEAAAIFAIRSSGQIATAGFITRADLIRSIATERFGVELAAMTAAELAEMSEAFGRAEVAVADVVWAELPLAVQVHRVSRVRAVVELWTVLLVGVRNTGAPRQAWRTVTVTLVWERDAWRIDDWTSVAGPTPALAEASTISDLAALEEVLAWGPVHPMSTTGGA